MFFSSRKKTTPEAGAATTSQSLASQPAAVQAAHAQAIPAQAATAQPAQAAASPQPAVVAHPAPGARPTASAAPLTNESQVSLTPEQLQAVAAKAQRDFALFGEIVSVFMRSAEHKHMSLAELERLVVPAIATRQFLVAMAQSKSNGKRFPVAVLLWASVSAEIDSKIAANGDKLPELEPKDWKSGEIPWLLGAAGNPQLFAGMFKQLQAGALKGRPIKFHTRTESGSSKVTAIAAE